MMKYGLMCDLSETEGRVVSAGVRAASHVLTPGQWPLGADGQPESKHWAKSRTQFLQRGRKGHSLF